MGYPWFFNKSYFEECQDLVHRFTFIYIEMNRLALWNASLMAPDIKETI